MNINCKIKLAPGAKMPHRATPGSTGEDCYAYAIQIFIKGRKEPWAEVKEGETVRDTMYKQGIPVNEIDYIKIDTGIAITPQEGWGISGRAQSRIATRGFLFQLGISTIDNDYTGRIFFLYAPRHGHAEYEIFGLGMKCGQIVYEEQHEPTYEVVNELPATERGNGGFGSTGSN